MAHPPSSPADDFQSARSLSTQSKSELLTNVFSSRIDGDDWSWVEELQDAAHQMDLGTIPLRSVVSDLAWETRQRGSSIPSSQRAREQYRLTWLYLQGQRLRFDYRFEELFRAASEWSRLYPDDSLILALLAFAAAGLRRPETSELIGAALTRADADVRTRHVCLHAAWFGQTREDAEVSLRISGEMIARGEADSNVYFRRARALRRLQRYDQAQEEVDRAIQMLAPSALTVHADYVRERELISAMREVDEHLSELMDRETQDFHEAVDEKIEESQRLLSREIAEANKSLSEGLLKIVEVLGIFISVVVFIVGSAFSALNARGFWQTTLATLTFLAGSLSFFVLLRIVTRFGKR